MTWFNAVNDQVAGIGAVVVTGTMRDSLHVLDVILGRDGGPTPELIATDTASSYSELVFGLFRLLGYPVQPAYRRPPGPAAVAPHPAPAPRRSTTGRSRRGDPPAVLGQDG